MKANDIISASIMRRFGAECSKRRNRLGLTVRSVSAATGLSSSMINRIELHTVQPSFAAALVLASFYRINVQRFVP